MTADNSHDSHLSNIPPAEGDLDQPLAISQEEIRKLLAEKKERLKELSAIHKTTNILKEEKPIPEMLQNIVKVLPPAWQYPDHTLARIRYGDQEFFSKAGFKATPGCNAKHSRPSTVPREASKYITKKPFPSMTRGRFLSKSGI